VPDYRAHLRRTLATGTGANGVFGAKIMFNQLPEVVQLARSMPEYQGLSSPALLEAMIGARTPLQWIWAKRNDTVRQAISMWKAIQTRSWSGDESAAGRSPEYRYEAIDHLVRRFEADDAGWRALFADHGLDPLIISYEHDLEVDRERTVQAVLDYVGIEESVRIAPGEPMSRQADALTQDWVDAYHRDRAAGRGQLAAVPEGAPQR
jgi:LPS sulfotransferase NodH